jgi:DNA modification methylase
MVNEQVITDKYAIYNGDCCEVMTTLPDESIHFSIYSPPFATSDGGLYHYSSSERDLSNSRGYEEFFQHYEFVVREIYRLLMPGRMVAVHCMDVPSGNTGCDYYLDFPGDIIRLHQKVGFRWACPRIHIWKEPLEVRNRTLTKALAHKSIVDDSSHCTVAGADYLLVFRKPGKNQVPITHEHGLTDYAGATPLPADVLRYRGWTGNQIENRYSHNIWRRYASCCWGDIRLDNVLPFREARDEEDEKHLHPLQLDVIERGLQLWSNPGERVLTPFMGVGSEVYQSVVSDRMGIGVELKPSYFRQAVKNMHAAINKPKAEENRSLFEDFEESTL